MRGGKKRTTQKAPAQTEFLAIVVSKLGETLNRLICETNQFRRVRSHYKGARRDSYHVCERHQGLPPNRGQEEDKPLYKRGGLQQ
jgi:hypothetical protein